MPPGKEATTDAVGDVLLDTHAFAWALTDDPQLSDTARAAMAGASAVLVSPASFYEIGLKVRQGRWPQMEPFVDTLVDRFRSDGGREAPLGAEITLRASRMEWAHRDPFDRMIGATALNMRLDLVSIDAVFDAIGSFRVW